MERLVVQPSSTPFYAQPLLKFVRHRLSLTFDFIHTANIIVSAWMENLYRLYRSDIHSTSAQSASGSHSLSFYSCRVSLVGCVDSSSVRRTQDLVTNATSSVSHDSKVDWLELNARADLLLFRDRRRRLHL